MSDEKLVFEISQAGRRGVTLPACDVPARPLAELLPGVPLREELRLPEVAQLDLALLRLNPLNQSVLGSTLLLAPPDGAGPVIVNV